MSEINFNRSEKEEFLDRYFYEKLVKLIATIDNPSVNDRREHIEAILDNLFSIADEYQSVMIEEEESFWDSIEEWNDKCRQEAAIKWIKEII